MEDSIVLLLLVFIVVGVMIAAFICGIVEICNANKRKKCCTEQVNAKIIDFNIKYTKNGKMYLPIYEYYYGGYTYTVDAKISIFRSKDMLNDYQTIYVNPKQPSEIYEESDMAGSDIGMVAIVIAFVVVVVCIGFYAKIILGL